MRDFKKNDKFCFRMESAEKIISGESTLHGSIRTVSPSGVKSPETLLSPPGRYLDVSDIIKTIFPDIDDNSLGERRDLLLKQAEQLENHNKTDINDNFSESFRTHSNLSNVTEGSGSVTSKHSSKVDKDYAENEEWHRNGLSISIKIPYYHESK